MCSSNNRFINQWSSSWIDEKLASPISSSFCKIAPILVMWQLTTCRFTSVGYCVRFQMHYLIPKYLVVTDASWQISQVQVVNFGLLWYRWNCRSARKMDRSWRCNFVYTDNCQLTTKSFKGSSDLANTYPTQQFLHTSGSHSLSAAKHGHWRLRHWLFAQWQPRKRFLHVFGHLQCKGMNFHTK